MKKILTLLAIALMSQSCMTTYDAYGRPVQSVDPAAATAGIIAAGVVGLAIGSANNSDRYYYRNDRSYYFRPYSHGHYSCY